MLSGGGRKARNRRRHGVRPDILTHQPGATSSVPRSRAHTTLTLKRVRARPAACRVRWSAAVAVVTIVCPLRHPVAVRRRLRRRPPPLCRRPRRPLAACPGAVTMTRGPVTPVVERVVPVTGALRSRTHHVPICAPHLGATAIVPTTTIIHRHVRRAARCPVAEVAAWAAEIWAVAVPLGTGTRSGRTAGTAEAVPGAALAVAPINRPPCCTTAGPKDGSVIRWTRSAVCSTH